jgi:hypothetical protein
MNAPEGIFSDRAEFDPAGDFDAFLRQTPAKWVVYLLADADDRPVHLLCVKNLRASLKRRLGVETETLAQGGAAPLSKRVNYRGLVRRIHWRRVDSAFEADWVYYEAARLVFPATYQGMVGFRPAWFVHVNPDAPFPRYTKTTSLTVRNGQLLGPVEDKHAAAKLIQIAEDGFDLCRYYQVLVEAPRGKACAYKEMGRCPAPCDGSISMESYRGMVAWSAETVVNPKPYLQEQQVRMKAAAADLNFESAGKIKAYLDLLAPLGRGPFRHVRRLREFTFLSFQHGPRSGTAKLFLITPGQIEETAGLIAEPRDPADLLRMVLAIAAERETAARGEAGAERIGIVSHHLFAAKQTHGAFLRFEGLDEKAFKRAFKDLEKQAQAEEVEGEGVMKELQALE